MPTGLRRLLLAAVFTGLMGRSLAWSEDAPAQRADDGKLVALNEQQTVWLDASGKRLILKSEVVLREGLLEMLVCLAQTKEHESILSVKTLAQTVHAGLLALGAEPGEGVRFTPEFKPPTGPRIDIFLSWKDADGKPRRVPAQSWVRRATQRYFVEPLARLPADVTLPKDKNLKYDPKQKEMLWYGPMTVDERNAFLALSKDKSFQRVIQAFFDQTQLQELEAHWVFAGSEFFTDEKTGEKFYQAEGGDLICVANFSSSVLDIDVESSDTNDGLLYEAYAERIPPVGTKVDIELVPVLKPAEKPAKK